jgi:hypothetical protein
MPTWMINENTKSKTALNSPSAKTDRPKLAKEDLKEGETYLMSGLQGSEYKLITNDGYNVSVLRIRDQKSFNMKTTLFVNMINKPATII